MVRTSGPKDSFPVVVGWSLYDLANTVFYLLVVTICLPKHLAELTGEESRINVGYLPAMVASAILCPAFGAVLQKIGGAKGWTLALTAGCVASTLAMAVLDSWVAISAVFGFGLVCYQLASVSYQSLLPHVASPAKAGRVSGLGVALGYLGNVVALALLIWTALEKTHGVEAVFFLAALAFLLFTIPFAWFVPAMEKRGKFHGKLFASEIAGTLGTLRRVSSRRGFGWFLIGNFLVCDAINTVLLQVSRYAEHPSGLGLTVDGRTRLMITINIAAVVGGLVIGRLADRTSGKAMTMFSGACLALGIAGAEWVPGTWFRQGSMAVLGGVGIAGVWTAGRLWLLQMNPEEEASEAFGMYGLTMKLSLLSLPAFTLLVDVTESYRSPILLVVAILLLGLLVWWRTPAGVVAEAGAPREAPTSNPQ